MYRLARAILYEVSPAGTHTDSTLPLRLHPRPQDWSTESLRWLSSQQALADLSSFHGYLSHREGLTGAEKWVTWGGE